MDTLTCDRCRADLPLDAAACLACGSVELTRRVYFDDTVSVAFAATATMDSRMSLTAAFLQSAALSSRDAYTLQVIAGTEHRDSLVLEHRRSVLTAVMLSAAALEAEMFEVVNHGPGHHLGTNGIDHAGKALLAPHANEIDRQPTLERYETVLRLLSKEPIKRGLPIWQNADAAIELRNELVHYKSQWNSQLQRESWLRELERKRHKPPSFIASSSAFFPERCLSADCARWCVESLAGFMNAFYARLGIISPLQPFAASFEFKR